MGLPKISINGEKEENVEKHCVNESYIWKINVILSLPLKKYFFKIWRSNVLNWKTIERNLKIKVVKKITKIFKICSPKWFIVSGKNAAN